MPHSLSHLPMLLINGQARSGTTVVTKALGAHPAVVSNLKESSYIAELGRFFKYVGTREFVIRQLPGTHEYFKTQFRNALLNVAFPEDQFSPTPESRFVSTFSSIHGDVADYLEEVLPDVQVVVIIRNGHEVVSSRRIHDTISKLADFKAHCVAWSKAIDMVKWGRGRDNFFLVRHESLKSEPECRKTFTDLQKHLGLPHSDAPADFVLNKLVNTTESEAETVNDNPAGNASPEDLRDAQLRQRSERWQTWTSDERKIFEDTCGNLMQIWGYKIPWQ